MEMRRWADERGSLAGVGLCLLNYAVLNGPSVLASLLELLLTVYTN